MLENQFSSVQLFSHVQLFVTQRTATRNAGLPGPSPTPGAYWNPCPSSWWCNPTISTSVIAFSFHLQSFSASGSFPMSQFFTSGGQSIGVSASASVLPMNIQDWFPKGNWLDLLAVQRTLKSLQSINSLVLKFLNSPTLISIHDYWKNHSFV